ncbi:hypothetical protein SSX86_008656 [Deinandra increscens subsp. villosa]|uniref:Ubiquitin-like protease family profile domain-containing protein n=1 Tax=Deinandra increscens subsp. villosa TaxID=3103831 RepID=A0AAP0H479_9ASTR
MKSFIRILQSGSSKRKKLKKTKKHQRARKRYRMSWRGEGNPPEWYVNYDSQFSDSRLPSSSMSTPEIVLKDDLLDVDSSIPSNTLSEIPIVDNNPFTPNPKLPVRSSPRFSNVISLDSPDVSRVIKPANDKQVRRSARISNVISLDSPDVPQVIKTAKDKQAKTDGMNNPSPQYSDDVTLQSYIGSRASSSTPRGKKRKASEANVIDVPEKPKVSLRTLPGLKISFLSGKRSKRRNPAIVEWRKRYPDKDVAPTHLVDQIMDSPDEDSFNFRMDFLMCFICVMVDCSSQGRVKQKIVKSIPSDIEWSDLNFCDYIVEVIKDCKKGWNKNKPSSSFKGPLAILTLLYVDSFLCKGMEIDDTQNAISFWTMKKLQLRQKMEVRNGGFGKGEFKGLSEVIDNGSSQLNHSGSGDSLSEMVSEVEKNIDRVFEAKQTADTSLYMLIKKFPEAPEVSLLQERYRSMFESQCTSYAGNSTSPSPKQSPTHQFGPKQIDDLEDDDVDNDSSSSATADDLDIEGQEQSGNTESLDDDDETGEKNQHFDDNVYESEDVTNDGHVSALSHPHQNEDDPPHEDDNDSVHEEDTDSQHDGNSENDSDDDDTINEEEDDSDDEESGQEGNGEEVESYIGNEVSYSDPTDHHETSHFETPRSDEMQLDHSQSVLQHDVPQEESNATGSVKDCDPTTDDKASSEDKVSDQTETVGTPINLISAQDDFQTPPQLHTCLKESQTGVSPTTLSDPPTPLQLPTKAPDVSTTKVHVNDIVNDVLRDINSSNLDQPVVQPLESVNEGHTHVEPLAHYNTFEEPPFSLGVSQIPLPLCSPDTDETDSTGITTSTSAAIIPIVDLWSPQIKTSSDLYPYVIAEQPDGNLVKCLDVKPITSVHSFDEVLKKLNSTRIIPQGQTPLEGTVLPAGNTMEQFTQDPKGNRVVTQRQTSLASALKSPYFDRGVTIDIPFTKEENKLWEIIMKDTPPTPPRTMKKTTQIKRNILNGSDTVFYSITGVQVSKAMMSTLNYISNVDSNVLKAFTDVMNWDEKKRSDSSPHRLFCPPHIIDQWTLYDSDIADASRLDTFVTNMDRHVSFNNLTSDLKGVDMVFFPVEEADLYYLIVFELKYPAISVIDTMCQNKPLIQLIDHGCYQENDSAYKMKQLFCGYLEKIKHPKLDRILASSIQRFNVDWATASNLCENHIFCMRHMEKFMGRNEVFDCDFATHGSTRKAQLRKLRKKYVATLLMSDANLLKSKINSFIK